MGILFSGVGADNDLNVDGIFNIAELGDGVLDFTFDLTDAINNGAVAGDVLTVNGQQLTITAGHISAGSLVFSLTTIPDGPLTLTWDVSSTAMPPVVRDSGVDMTNIDATAPTGTTITTPIEGDDFVNASEAGDVLVEGTAEAGASVEVTFDDGANPVIFVTVMADATTGAWTLSGNEVDVSGLNDGSLTISAAATDATGNIEATPATAMVTLDATAPTGTTITTPIEGNGFVDAAEAGDVLVEGTAEAGASVEVTFDDGANPVISVTVMADAITGAWTLSGNEVDVSGLNDGSLTISAAATDATGNIEATPATAMVTLDATAPTGTTITTPIEGDDFVNASEAGDVLVEGTAEAGASVEVTFDDGANPVIFVTVMADATTGAWTLSGNEVDVSGLNDGSLTISAAATDATGNIEATPATAIVTLDTAAPAAPTIVLDAASDSGVASDNETNNTTPTLTITAEAGTDVEVFIDGLSAGMATPTATPNEFTFTPSSALVGGASVPYVFTAVSTDAAGNSSSLTPAGLTVTIDNDAPADETDATTSAENADGFSATAGLTSGDSLQTFAPTDGTTYGFDSSAPDGGNPGNAFVIIGNQLIVNTEAYFDYEARLDSMTGVSEVVATIIATDDAGNTTSFTHTVTLTDINDAPVIVDPADLDLTPMLTEGTDLSSADSTIDGMPVGEATGSFLFTDDDISDSHAVGVTLGTSTNGTFFGTFTVGLEDFAQGDGQGEIEWTFKDLTTADQAIIDALPAGATIVQTYSITIIDSSGAVTSQPITLTITGSNDVPIITASLSEDTDVVETGGVLNGTAGDSTAGGTLTIVDVDTGESSFQTPTPASLTGSYGDFIFDAATGVWSYALVDSRAATEALDDMDAATDTLTVTSFDGTAMFNIVVNITGSNDNAVVTGADTGAVVEAGGIANGTAGTLTAMGNLDHTDVDMDDADDAWMATAGTPIVGTYGSLEIDGFGNWVYTLDDTFAATEALDAGDIATDTITVTTTDGTTHDVVISVTGSSDNAVVTGVDTGAVIEAGVDASNAPIGAATAMGNLDHTDVDMDDADDAWTATAGTPIVGTYGSLEIDSAGNWVYTLDDALPATQALDDGDPATDTITVTTMDGTTHDIVVNITGSNDNAVVTGADTGAVVEAGGIANGTAGTLTAMGNLDHTDVDMDDADDAWMATAGTPIVGTYGSLEIDGFGNWVYTLDDTFAATEALDAGDIATDTITVTTTDGTTHDVVISVTGSSDNAVVTGVDTGAVIEAGVDASNAPIGAATAMGNLDHTDVDMDDADDAWTATAGTPIVGTYGSLEIDSAGNWVYTLDDALPATQALDDGDPATDTITVTTMDGTTHDIVVNITGSNDNAVVTGADTGAVVEAGGIANGTAGTLTAMGNLDHTDVDMDDADDAWMPATHLGTYGSLVIDGFGNWVYTLDDNDVDTQALNAGDLVMDTITVTTMDGTSHDIVIDVTGSNDNASISGTASGSVIEAGVNASNVSIGAPGFSGMLTVADVDDGEAELIPSSTVGDNGFGTFTILADGTWSYVLDDNNATIQALDETQSTTDTITVMSEDGTASQLITVTILGSNDAPFVNGPIISSDFVENTMTGRIEGGITELDDLATMPNENAFLHEIDLQINFDDYETADIHTGTINAIDNVADGLVTGDYLGTFLVGFQPSGNVTFDFEVQDADLDFLGEGETRVQLYEVSVSDDSAGTLTRTIEVTLEGSNDAPTVTASVGDTQTAAESEGAIALSGTVTLEDVDVSDTLELASVTVDNGGDPDAPSDPDLLAMFTPATATGIIDGTMTTGTHAWNFNVTDGFDYLAVGQSLTLTYTLRFEDSSGEADNFVEHDVVITVTGTNDAPVVAAALTGAANEGDAGFSLDMLAGASDVDTGAVLSVANVTGLVPGVTFDGVSGLSVDPTDAAFEALAQGQDEVITVSYDVVDEHGATVAQTATITITGTNDAPVVAAALTGAANEGDAGFSLDMLAGASDVDTGAVLSVANVTGLVPGVTFDGVSGLSVDPTDAAFEALAQGQDEVITVSYDVVDEHGATVAQTATITITGTNDAPIIALDAAAPHSIADSVVADAIADVTGTLTVTDLDVNDMHLFSIGDGTDPLGTVDMQSSAYGTLTVNPDGTYSFDVDNAAVDALDALQTASVSFDVQVSDGIATDTDTLTFNFTGVNDNPIANNDAAAVDEGQIITFNAVLGGAFDIVVDTDAEGHSLTITGGGDSSDASTAPPGVTLGSGGSTTLVGGAPGNFTTDWGADVTLNSDGTIFYNLTGSTGAYQELGANDTAVDTFTYNIDDGNGGTATATVSITITGENDVPVAQDIAVMGTEDGSINIMPDFVDADSSDSHTFTIDSSATTGTVTLLPNGTFDYDPNGQFESLDDGETATDSFGYTVIDAAGTSSTRTVTVTINGANDAPVVSGNVDLGAVLEDNSFTILEADLLANATDFDVEGLSVVNLNASSGILVDNMDGTWTFTPALHDDTDVSFSYDVSDGTVDTAATASLDITPVNDAAVISGDVSGSSAEDGGAITGTLTSADVDNADNSFQVDAGASVYGTYAVDAAGEWTYTLDDANPVVDALNVGDSLMDSFVVLSEDGTSQTVTITIDGANDAAVFSGDVSGTSTEDGGAISGTLFASDVDNADNSFLAAGAALTYGTYAVDAAGEWTYTLDDANPVVDALNVGDSLTESFVVQSEDGTSQTVTITIDGTNDAAAISGDVSGSSAEDGGAITGTLTSADVDNADNSFQVDAGASVYGTYAVDAAGEWTYTLDDANPVVDALNVGDSLMDSFVVLSEDGTSQTVTITIDGANDAPVVAGPISESATEDDAFFAVDLLFGESDVDSSSLSIVAGSVTGLQPGVILAGSTLNVDPSDSVFQSLPEGITETITVSYDIIDGDGGIIAQTATITIIGTNDIPVVGGASTGNVIEDNTTPATGVLTISDTDTGEAVFEAITANNPRDSVNGFGTFEVLADGTWTYTLDSSNPSVQALEIGETTTDSITVMSLDGSESIVLTVTITGAVNYIVGTSGADSITGQFDEDDIRGANSDDVIDAGTGEDVVRGDAGNDTISGGSDDDLLFGGADNDIVYGDDGEDRLFGGDGDDILSGGADDDFLRGDAGDDVLYGNEGNDDLRGSDGNDTLHGNGGEDLLFGGNGDDELYGGADIDNLRGEAGNDSLFGGDGNDNLLGGAGDDVLRGEAGNDRLFGNTGEDRLLGGDGDDLLFGGSEDDDLRGEAGEDRLFGGDGNDTLLGGSDDDFLRGDAGDDVLFGGDGNDDLRGSEGDDRLLGQLGTDRLFGGDGDDALFGGDGDDDLRGEAGNDMLVGADGKDDLRGGDGEDSLLGGSGEDDLRGEAGDDRLLGQDGDDVLLGGDGNDVLLGGAGDDSLRGDDGNDDLRGDVGDDILLGGNGDDALRGDSGDDRLIGGDGEDVLIGGDGDDSLVGGNDDDDLRGEAGNDRLLGGDGDDLVSGGLGDDILTGGSGDDTFVFTAGDGFDRITDFDDNGDDIIDLSTFGFTSYGDIAAVMTQVGAHVEIDLGNGDVLRLDGTDIADMDADDFVF